MASDIDEVQELRARLAVLEPLLRDAVMALQNEPDYEFTARSANYVNLRRHILLRAEEAGIPNTEGK